MSLPLLVVDDSSFARKQVIKALPKGWDVEISQASHGQEALELISQGKGEVVLLDLTMPVMDGYGVLESIRARDLPAVVIVISGDIQPEAEARVKKLGALAFVKKPLNTENLLTVLNDFGLYSE
ncbi:response regulator [Reinekea marinisedimentorum]|uniref:Response regulator receiver domain-containing protein n=1 Tax=Reinekea marinisedimentorum TaxID=230495 RepID=A0A4R3IEL2_9GAMM|nr:response regulator [Reinekea marinisedimentorum]TCS43231.1 response regulator receiver domain-containing protein [Reinekea marinisedimentorum]